MTTILQALDDQQLFGSTFQGDSWRAWRAVLAASFALPMTPDQSNIFSELSGRREPPRERVSELFVIAGRRSAKTHIAAAIACYLGTIGAQVDGIRLSPGERGVIAILAVDRQQAKVAMGYVRGMLEASPIFAGMIERVQAESIDLQGNVSIEVHTNSYRAIRGRTLIAAIFDEASFWRSESTTNPDLEVYRAAMPALATTNGLLIGISSPYAKSGLMFQKWKKHYGQPGDVLVIQGATQAFNPTISDRVINQALQDDPEAARSEWLGLFRNDISGFVTREVAEACISPGVFERGRLDGVEYFGFCDPSGGSSDSMTMAIGHLEGERIVIDLIREAKPPFSPESVAQEFAETFKSYKIQTIEGDRFAGEWPREQFRKYGVQYSASAAPKSELYQALLPKLNSGQIDLIDNERMLNQLLGLERRTARSGRDSIDHGPAQHDDLINAAAGVAAMAQPKKRPVAVFGTYGQYEEAPRGYRMAEEPATPTRLFGTSGQEDRETQTYQDSAGNFHHY